jgi:hypothetical protein
LTSGQSGLELYPIQLPLSQRGPVEFTELVRKEAFSGLPGVFADSLPDSFGNLVGTWRLAPAYDVTFAKGSGFTAQHQMRVADKQTGITRSELRPVASNFAIKGAARIIDQTLEVVSRWPDYARAPRVPPDTVNSIGGELARRRSSLE